MLFSDCEFCYVIAIVISFFNIYFISYIFPKQYFQFILISARHSSIQNLQTLGEVSGQCFGDFMTFLEDSYVAMDYCYFNQAVENFKYKFVFHDLISIQNE